MLRKKEKKEAKQPKRRKTGRPAKASHLLCCGPDLATVHSDLDNALAVTEASRQIEVTDMHLRQNPCVIVEGKKEELERLKTYLVTRGRYVYP